jgi:PEGA domain
VPIDGCPGRRDFMHRPCLGAIDRRRGMALPLLTIEVHLPGDPLVTYPSRTIIALLACMATAALWPADAAAQHRAHRVGTRASTVVVAGPAFYGYGYYHPLYWGYPGWYPYGAYAPDYQPYFYDNIGSARIQVTPKNAEVYVDGYFVGTVDDFDGFLQRLDVPAGEHELTFYLEGYQTIRQDVLFRPGVTLKISYTMARLPAGATTEPRPRPAPGAARPAARPSDAPPEREARESHFGSIAIRVQPADATILVDGEEWAGPEGQGPLLIDLGEGSHDVEVRKQGFATYETTVRVRAGQTTALNVSLSR